MLIVASTNGKLALPTAMQVLQEGGTALDAVEIATRIVESNEADHSVGRGGLPNLLGEVELDASIMDGRTLAAGAVGALKGFEHPIAVARHVMEELPHVMLVGEGAARFAAEMGFEPTELLTPAAEEIWRSKAIEFADARGPAMQKYIQAMRGWVRAAADPERPFETVNFIAIDQDGNLASAVSTSGYPWKYPGRVGDSPIIGAGNYCDNRFGAATCTGRGEMAMRILAAHRLILLLQLGFHLRSACQDVMHAFASLQDDYHGQINIIAVTPDGQHFAASNREGQTYVYMTRETAEPVELEREFMTGEQQLEQDDDLSA